MKKSVKYFGIFIILLLVVSVIAALFDSEEETTEPEKIETSALVEEEAEVVELSAAQQTAIERFHSHDFMTFVDSFYALESAERSEIYSSNVEGQIVTWSGIITDLDTMSDSVVIIGKDSAYNGADWNTLNTDNKDLLPYVIVVEMNDPSVKSTLKVGEPIVLTGEIGARGDVEMQYNWKLYKGENVD